MSTHKGSIAATAKSDTYLFQGRYKAILVERDNYLMELARYVVLNPVRAKIVKKPEDYRWSSYRSSLGFDAMPTGLSTDGLLSQFAKTKRVARQRYKTFVQAGIGLSSPWEALRGQVLLGSDAFVEKFAPPLESNALTIEIPKRQRHLRRPPLTQLLAHIKSRQARNEAMTKAYGTWLHIVRDWTRSRAALCDGKPHH